MGEMIRDKRTGRAIEVRTKVDALMVQRAGHWCWERGIPLLPTILNGVSHVLFCSALAPAAHFGRGVVVGSKGFGIAVHRRAWVGNHVRIAASVTIGGRSRHVALPSIGDGAYLGVGARILGPVVVGPGAVVGANAVVLEDVPPRSMVVGVPARIIRRGIRPEDYY
jgi:serine O-acetyltransferase